MSAEQVQAAADLAASIADSDIVIIRASALSDLYDCPARFEAKVLLGMRLPTSSAAHLGTAIHKSTAVYDQSTIDGAGITIDDAAGAAVDVIRKPSEDIAWDEDLDADGAEKIALALHKKYCEQIAPSQNYAAVEVTCERLVISDLGIALQGTTDRVRRVDGGAAISDLKSGKNAVRADGHVDVSKHAIQLGVYELLAEQSLKLPITGDAEIIGLQTGKTDKAQRVAKAPVASARSILVGDDDKPGVLSYAAQIIKAGLFYGNPRSNLCSEKYCPRFNNCPFRA